MAKEDNQLNVLKRIEVSKEQEAALALQSANSFLMGNQSKLKDVERYKIEYLKKLQEKGMNGVTGDSYAHYQRFIVQLEQGIEAQSRVVDTAKQVVEQRKNDWLAQKNKVTAVQTLLTKKQSERQARLEKQEQNQQDEFASQLYIRNQLRQKQQLLN
jgi:flagellar protein FliJ